MVAVFVPRKAITSRITSAWVNGKAGWVLQNIVDTLQIRLCSNGWFKAIFFTHVPQACAVLFDSHDSTPDT